MLANVSGLTHTPVMGSSCLMAPGDVDKCWIQSGSACLALHGYNKYTRVRVCRQLGRYYVTVTRG